MGKTADQEGGSGWWLSGPLDNNPNALPGLSYSVGNAHATLAEGACGPRVIEPRTPMERSTHCPQASSYCNSRGKEVKVLGGLSNGKRDMRGGVNDPGGGSRLKRLATLSGALVGALWLAACGPSWSPVMSSSSRITANSSAAALPRHVVLPLNAVNRFFPEVTQEASTGQNSTAIGNPKATRSVVYVTADTSKQVTISVDRYESTSEASSAYQQAVQKSKIVPGFKAVAIRISANNHSPAA